VKEGTPATFVAAEAGEYEIACSVICGAVDDHKGMTAKLVIK
jgi:cytochrome c oxidase subunit 2